MLKLDQLYAVVSAQTSPNTPTLVTHFSDATSEQVPS